MLLLLLLVIIVLFSFILGFCGDSQRCSNCIHRSFLIYFLPRLQLLWTHFYIYCTFAICATGFFIFLFCSCLCECFTLFSNSIFVATRVNLAAFTETRFYLCYFWLLWLESQRRQLVEVCVISFVLFCLLLLLTYYYYNYYCYYYYILWLWLLLLFLLLSLLLLLYYHLYYYYLINILNKK